MIIRDEIISDVPAIRAITEAAFAPIEHSEQTEATIIEALREAGALRLSLVAVDDDEIVGHIAFSSVKIDGADKGWYGLGPISVRPDRQKQGIGATLVREGLQRLITDNAKGCVLLGNPDYYSRFGFEADPTLILAGVPPEYFMRLAFQGDAPIGHVSYHSAFNGK